MSDTLRELLVEINYKDKASSPLEKVDKKVDSVKDGFGAMGKSVSMASVGVADFGSNAKKATKDIEKIDKRHKLWQQTASGMDKVLHSNEMQTDSLRQKIAVLDRELTTYPKTLNKISKKYGENSKEVREYKDNVLDLRLEHAKLNKEIGGFGAATMGKSLTKAGGVMTSAGSWMTKNLSLPIAVAAGASIKTFVTLEDAFSDVKKTVEGTPEQLKNIRKELDYMASNTIPVARKELYGIASNAGQLGVMTKDVTKFTDTIAKLGATTDLSYDASSSQLAQFASFTGMDIGNIDRLGSTIVELGNNTVATEVAIVDMAMKIGAAGKQVNMSHSEIMGLSAGLASLGLASDAGGTAVSKLLFDMQEATMTGNKQLGKYAKVARVTSKQFKKAFEDNATNALTMFTGGLGDLQKNGGNVIGMLNDMGLCEVRLRDAILRAAGANGSLNSSINTGNIAWEQNIALNEEFSKKTETNASNIQLMKSKVEGLGNAFGEHLIPYVNTALDGITGMVDKFGELSPKTQSNIFDGLLGVMVAGPLINKLGKFAIKLGVLNTKVAAMGGWGAFLSTAGASLIAFATGPVGIAILALGLLAGAILLIVKNWDKVKNGEFLNNTGGNYTFGGPNSSHLSSGTTNKPKVEKSTSSTTPTFNSTQWNKIIGNNALGTNYWKGGLSELGERGPELVVGRQTRNLSKGAKVVNNRETEDMFKNEGNSNVTQDATFAPVVHVYLTDGNRQELDKAKETLKREFETLMEDFFYRYRKKIASAT